MNNSNLSPITIITSIALALGIAAQPRSAAAGTGAYELGCRLAHGEVQYSLNGPARCVKTVHETAQPSCPNDFRYLVQTGEDKCIKMPFNIPPPGSLIAVPTEDVACPPADVGGHWRLGIDVIGRQDQCQRNRLVDVAPATLGLAGAQAAPLKK